MDALFLILAECQQAIGQLAMVTFVNRKISVHEFHFAYIDHAVGPIYQHVDLVSVRFFISSHGVRRDLRGDSFDAQCPFYLSDMVKADFFERNAAPSLDRTLVFIELPEILRTIALFHKMQPEPAEMVDQFVMHLPFGTAMRYVLDDEVGIFQRLQCFRERSTRLGMDGLSNLLARQTLLLYLMQLL